MPALRQAIEIAPSVTVPLRFFEDSTTPCAIVRDDGLILHFNKRLLAMMETDGLPRARAGMNLNDMEPRAFWDERMVVIRRLASEGQSGVIRDIFNGEQYISHLRILPKHEGETHRHFVVMQHKQHGPVTDDQFPDDIHFHDASAQDLGPLALLSPRELEVLALVGEGLTAAQIADRMHRSEDTVNTHKASLLRKLGCQNAVQLALVAQRAGLKREDGERLQG